MAYIRADLIKETTLTRGTGNITTAGATIGSRPFSAVCSLGDTFAYSLRGFDLLGNPTGEFEAGIGTYVGVNTIARTTVQVSSNGGSPVSLASPFAQIAIALTAEDVNTLESQLSAYAANVAGPAGASMVGAADGLSIELWLSILRGGTAAVHADQFLGTSNPILNAINALPASGGVVVVSIRSYPPVGTNYDAGRISKDNVRIVGAKMPVLSANADRLEGGSVIQGRFNVFAHNFSIENIGFDCGKYVVDTYYGGLDTHTANHPLGGTWDAFTFAQPPTPIGVRRGFYARNVIGLCRDSNTVGHSILIEGVDGGFVDNVVGMYSMHPVVFKSKNIIGGSVMGYSASSQGVLFKSDTIASCEKIQLANVEANRYPPGVTPWSAPPIPSFGILINPATNALGQIQIGTAKAFGATRGVNFDGAVGQVGADIQIGQLICDGFTGTMDYAVIGQHATFERIQIGQVIANNANQAVYWEGIDTLEIDSLRATQIANHAVMAIGSGRVRIGTVKFTTCGSAYYIDDTARIYVGSETISGVTTKWARTPPALAANWSNFGAGNSTFDVMLKNYSVEVKGLIKASAGATASLITMPTYLRPLENQRLVAHYNNGAISDALVNINSSSAGVEINNGTAPAANDYISLDRIAWEY
jgi:hypothetical protein